MIISPCQCIALNSNESVSLYCDSQHTTAVWYAYAENCTGAYDAVSSTHAQSGTYLNTTGAFIAVSSTQGHYGANMNIHGVALIGNCTTNDQCPFWMDSLAYKNNAPSQSNIILAMLFLFIIYQQVIPRL